MTALILFFVLAVCISFMCSILEAVILSVTHGHIETLIKEHHKSGRLLKELKEGIDQPLSAILTVNTIANTVGAAGVGAQALKLFGSGWAAAASGILTFCILVFSEIIPKTVGAAYWKKLAPVSAYLIRTLIWITYPLVLSFQAISKLISPDTAQQFKVTREEMIALAGIGEDEGTLLEKEKRVIENLLRLKHVRAGEVMTPRSVVQAFQQEETVDEVTKKHSMHIFTRVPVFGASLDEITGVVLRGAILQALAAGELNKTMGEMALPVHAVPETQSVAGTLDDFIARREHLFLVVDEYGGTEGIITLEDAIETLLGVEIVDEVDSVEDMRKLAFERWEKRKKKMNL